MLWFNRVPKHLPKATGPYAPGCVDIHTDYTSDGLFFRIYYPSVKSSEEVMNFSKWCPTIPDEDCTNGLADHLMISPYILKFFWWKSGKPLAPVLYGEKILPRDKYKCIIMSHGYAGLRTFYNAIFCELASRGYVVFSLEHKDRSSCFTYYYDSKEDYQKGIKTSVPLEKVVFGKGHYPIRNKQVHERADECSKALSFILQLNKRRLPKNLFYEATVDTTIDFKMEDFFGKIDLDHLGVIGHSFGGATSLVSLSKHPELKYGIILDPWMFPIKGEDLVEKVKQPLIFVNTQTFHIVANVTMMEKYLKENEMYTITGTTHENHIDAIFIFGSWLNWFMWKLDPLKAIKINNYLILKFLKKHTGHEEPIEDCQKFLDQESQHYLNGLTKPWA